MNVLSFLFIFYLILVKIDFISRFYLFCFFRNDALENDEWCKILYFIQFIFILFQVTIFFMVLVFIVFNDKNPDFGHTYLFFILF